MEYIQNVYGADYSLSELVITDGSDLIGKTLDDIESANRIRVIASKHSGRESRFGPGTLGRDTEVQAGMVLGVVCQRPSRVLPKWLSRQARH